MRVAAGGGMWVKEILRWRCSRCGKELTSLYPAQLDMNRRVHLAIHEREEAGREGYPPGSDTGGGRI